MRSFENNGQFFRGGWVLWLLALIVSAGCGQSPSSAKPRQPAGPDANWFEDATASSGVDFVHQADAPGNYLFYESIGSGAAFLDFDNDGRLDLYFIHNAHPTNRALNRLYHQQADGHFRDVSAGSGLDVAGHGQGLAGAMLTTTVGPKSSSRNTIESGCSSMTARGSSPT